MQINVEYLKLAQDFERGYMTQSDENKATFLSLWTVVKKHKPKEREGFVKELIKASATIKSDNARRAYKSVLNQCLTYQYLPDNWVNMTAIEWDTLKRVLTITKRVINHYNDGVTAVKPISTVWESGMSPHRYNTLLNEKLKELYEEYPAPSKVEQVTYDKVYNTVEKLSVEDKRKLLEQLTKELKEEA